MAKSNEKKKLTTPKTDRPTGQCPINPRHTFTVSASGKKSGLLNHLATNCR